MPITHEWNGTILTITSDSGTSSANLIGPTGADGPRGPMGIAGSCIAEDTTHLGGVAAEDYATKNYVSANAAPYSLIDYTPYGGRKNFVSNLLLIDLQNRDGFCNQSSVIATEDASTLINSPITTGAFYAYREVMFIDNPTGGLPKCVVRLTQAYPLDGVIWVNIYDPNIGYWIGWKDFKPSQNYVPVGYGWGSDLPCFEYQSADNANKTSVFYATQGTPTPGFGTWLCEFYSTSTGGAYGHMVATCQDDGKQGCVCTRLKADNVWQPWEWVNPPMWLGVEYRTTKRHNGHVVYTKAVHFGELPNNAEKGVLLLEPNVNVVSFSGYAVGNYTLPITGYKNITSFGITKSTGNVWISTDANMSGYNAYLTFEYYKE